MCFSLNNLSEAFDFNKLKKMPPPDLYGQTIKCNQRIVLNNVLDHILENRNLICLYDKSRLEPLHFFHNNKLVLIKNNKTIEQRISNKTLAPEELLNNIIMQISTDAANNLSFMVKNTYTESSTNGITTQEIMPLLYIISTLPYKTQSLTFIPDISKPVYAKYTNYYSLTNIEFANQSQYLNNCTSNIIKKFPEIIKFPENTLLSIKNINFDSKFTLVNFIHYIKTSNPNIKLRSTTCCLPGDTPTIYRGISLHSSRNNGNTGRYINKLSKMSINELIQELNNVNNSSITEAFQFNKLKKYNPQTQINKIFDTKSLLIKNLISLYNKNIIIKLVIKNNKTKTLYIFNNEERDLEEPILNNILNVKYIKSKNILNTNIQNLTLNLITEENYKELLTSLCLTPKLSLDILRLNMIKTKNHELTELCNIISNVKNLTISNALLYNMKGLPKIKHNIEITDSNINSFEGFPSNTIDNIYFNIPAGYSCPASWKDFPSTIKENCNIVVNGHVNDFIKTISNITDFPTNIKIIKGKFNNGYPILTQYNSRLCVSYRDHMRTLIRMRTCKPNEIQNLQEFFRVPD